jgi:predicted nucleic acid-binding protein
MPHAALIDTGAILAIIDADELHHQSCMAPLAFLRLPLLTTEAVLTEVFHFVAARSLNLKQSWEFVRSGALTVLPMNDSHLPELRALMMQYADRPMDFADATLVHLAEREGLSVILTLDHDDFETYRIGGRKKFTILPSRKQQK